MKKINLLFLYLLPKNLFSYCFGVMANIKWPQFMLKPMIRLFCHIYQVNMNEAKDCKYYCFNEFFTRELREECRPINTEKESIISPVDGIIGHSGSIDKNTLIQAKGRTYSLEAFVAKKEYVDLFTGGVYLTIYLSPSHYHRIHAPISGDIKSLCYIPGKLYPVNPFAINNIDCIFAKNERLITIVKSEIFGNVAVVKVGATNVGKIKVVYDSITSNNLYRKGIHRTYQDISIIKGKELGRFELGSTVILLFENNNIRLTQTEFGSDIRLGEKIAIQ